MARGPAEARGFRWGDLRQRVISAALLAPLALSAIWLGKLPWAAIVALVTLGIAWEWVLLCGFRPASMPGLAVPLSLLVVVAVAAVSREGAAFGVIALGLAAVWAVSGSGRGVPPAGRPRSPASLALGVLYIGIPAVAIIWLRGREAGLTSVLFLILIVWSSDIGAYMAGRLIGGPRLAPRISPSKTWAGAAGGLAAAICAGIVVGLITGEQAAGIWRIAAVAALLGAVAQAGDLLESGLKRRFGVKDSGRLIPGHGGLLDRLDGVLTAAPVAALLALVLGHGGMLWR